MKERSPVKKNILKLIPYIEIIAGVIFLCLEIHDYRTLYSMAEADAMYGGLADFCKYKENVFCPAFFWIIVILTGLSYWKNKKIYWILTQALVFMVFFRAMFPFYAIFIELNPVVFYILPLLYSTVFFVVERKLFKIKQIDSVDITVKTKITGIGIGILCTIINARPHVICNILCHNYLTFFLGNSPYIYNNIEAFTSQEKIKHDNRQIISL